MTTVSPGNVSRRFWEYLLRHSNTQGRVSAETLVEYYIDAISLYLGIDHPDNVNIDKLKYVIGKIQGSSELQELNSLRNFRRFLTIFEEYLAQIGVTGLLDAMNQTLQSFSGADYESSEPLISPVSAVPPIDLNASIPGTAYTYRQLLNAIRPTELGVQGICAASRYVGVHRAVRELANPLVAFQILQSVVRLDPNYTISTIGDLQPIYRSMMDRYLRRSDNPAFQNEQHRMRLIDAVFRKVSDAITVGDLIVLGPSLSIPPAAFVLWPLLFVNTLPTFWQTRWAENVIRQTIEAYLDYDASGTKVDGTTIATYDPNNPSESHISCAQGAVERHFIELATVLGTSEPARTPTPSTLPTFTSAQRTRFFDNWYQVYSNPPNASSAAPPQSEAAFRAFVDTKIRALDPPNNDPNAWQTDLNAYIARLGDYASWVGGKRRTYRKRRRSTRAKRLR